MIRNVTSTSLLLSALEIFNPIFVRGWLEGVSLPSDKGLSTLAMHRQGWINDEGVPTLASNGGFIEYLVQAPNSIY